MEASPVPDLFVAALSASVPYALDCSAWPRNHRYSSADVLIAAEINQNGELVLLKRFAALLVSTYRPH